MNWIDWTLLGVYLGGLVLGWLIVLLMSFDTDWKFTDFINVILWPIMVPLILLGMNDPRKLPDWVRRHWG